MLHDGIKQAFQKAQIQNAKKGLQKPLLFLHSESEHGTIQMSVWMSHAPFFEEPHLQVRFFLLVLLKSCNAAPLKWMLGKTQVLLLKREGEKQIFSERFFQRTILWIKFWIESVLFTLAKVKAIFNGYAF